MPINDHAGNLDTQVVQSYCRYWSVSLLDAEIQQAFSEDPFVLSGRLEDAVLGGQVPDEIHQKLLKSRDRLEGQTDESEAGPRRGRDNGLLVYLAPYVAILAHEHEQENDRSPRYIVPLIIPAQLQDDGLLQVPANALPWIPREYLLPSEGEVILGSMQEVDHYLDLHPQPVGVDRTWHGWLAWGMGLLPDGWHQRLLDQDYRMEANQVAIIVASATRGISRSLVRTYRSLEGTLRRADEQAAETPATALNNPPTAVQLVPAFLRWVGAQTPASPLIEPDTTAGTEAACRHLAHVADYPLSPSQRRALAHCLPLEVGDIQAINGPPGTGKTTLLQSIWSSLWVQAALVPDGAPPVVVVSSTNNQAVVNALDALSKNQDMARWLPEPLLGLGLYLVNDPARQQDAEQQGHHWLSAKLDGLFERLESRAYLDQAGPAYLDAARGSAFAWADQVKSTPDVVFNLQKDLRQVETLLCRVEQLRLQFHQEVQKTRKAYQEGLTVAHETVTAKLQILQGHRTDWESMSNGWLQYLQTPTLIDRFLLNNLWLPGARRRLARHDQSVLQALGLPEDELTEFQFPDDRALFRTALETFQNDLKNEIGKEEARQRSVQQQTSRMKVMQDALHAAIHALLDDPAWRIGFPGKDIPIAPLDIVARLSGFDDAMNHMEAESGDGYLDITVRRALIQMAVHYWEGRWLLATEAAVVKRKGKRKDLQNAAARRETWQRFAMVTPVMVTTMYTGPGVFDCFEQGRATPHWRLIDWLILDEAGQISPEIAGAMVALSRRAVVIGDVQQIQPVHVISTAVDMANAVQQGVARDGAEYERRATAGLWAASGNAMEAAQRVTRFSENTDAPGLWLTEHRRCVDPIIAYCNALAYQGRIVPCRGLQGIAANFQWPHMGLIPIEHGESRPLASGSRANPREAQALAQWLSQQQVALLAYYQDNGYPQITDLNDIVAVLTPFRAQERLLRHALRKTGIRLGKVGTIHTMQGAERPMVLFSPVYTAQDQGFVRRFDQSTEMLNVAVSRAMDSFLVVGDPGVFRAGGGSPSSVLAGYLQVVPTAPPDFANTRATAERPVA